MTNKLKTTRWWFQKQTGNSNAFSMARDLEKQTGLEIFSLYRQIFYDIREYWKKKTSPNSIERSEAEKLHDHTAKAFLNAVAYFTDAETWSTCRKYIFMFNQ